VNRDYASAIDATYGYTDDAIFFSQLLCQDLNEHGSTLLAGFKKRFRGNAVKVNKPNFAKAQKAGLMPSDDVYADCTSAFVKS
jgi:hypothetical protein